MLGIIKMPRKGENVYKRKDGRWEGRYIKSRNSAGKAVYGYVYARSYRELKTKQGVHAPDSPYSKLDKML